MSDTLASFRELKGIGPAIEAKLHEAGVHTWEALAEIVNALGNVRGSTGDTLRELSESIAARAAEPAPVPVETTSKPPAPAESRDHVVVLDVGKAVGGSRRNLEWVVSTARLTDISEFEYQATLAGRAYGQTPEKWATLAGHTGSGHPPDSLQLRFEAVELPPGVQRLRLQLALRLPSPKETPALELR